MVYFDRGWMYRMVICCVRGCGRYTYPGQRFCYRHWMRRLNTGAVLIIGVFVLIALAFQWWGLK